MHTVHVGFGFHVNCYHSYRGDTPDALGFGGDIRIMRHILDTLDDLLPGPQVQAGVVVRQPRGAPDVAGVDGVQAGGEAVLAPPVGDRGPGGVERGGGVGPRLVEIVREEG